MGRLEDMLEIFDSWLYELREEIAGSIDSVCVSNICGKKVIVTKMLFFVVLCKIPEYNYCY